MSNRLIQTIGGTCSGMGCAVPVVTKYISATGYAHRCGFRGFGESVRIFKTLSQSGTTCDPDEPETTTFQVPCCDASFNPDGFGIVEASWDELYTVNPATCEAECVSGSYEQDVSYVDGTYCLSEACLDSSEGYCANCEQEKPTPDFDPVREPPWGVQSPGPDMLVGGVDIIYGEGAGCGGTDSSDVPDICFATMRHAAGYKLSPPGNTMACASVDPEGEWVAAVSSDEAKSGYVKWTVDDRIAAVCFNSTLIDEWLAEDAIDEAVAAGTPAGAPNDETPVCGSVTRIGYNYVVAGGGTVFVPDVDITYVGAKYHFEVGATCHEVTVEWDVVTYEGVSEVSRVHHSITTGFGTARTLYPDPFGPDATVCVENVEAHISG